MSNQAVLVVEDDADLRQAICHTLTGGDYSVLEAESGPEALSILDTTPVGLVVSDIQMEPMSGHELLNRIKKTHPTMPAVLMSAFGTIESAVDGMRNGASDYLVKPFEAKELIETVDRHLADESNCGNIIAADPRTIELLSIARRVAKSDATVTLSGESGTGKEVFARFIHENSKRSQQPFVAINCAAIPENMLEAVLFGHEKGAFTGANKSHAGKFEQANGGTLLLDEISEMDLGLQAKILRVIQEKEVERIGGQETIALNVRVLATTNRNLRQYVADDKFREDLYYRLNVFPIQIPPLRERTGDILPLAESIIKNLNEADSRLPILSSCARKALLDYDWPGNVRELENILQRGLILLSGLEIRAIDLPFERPIHESDEGSPRNESSCGAQLQEDLLKSEFNIIVDALKEAGGNKTATASKLGISPRTLRYKLAKMRSVGLTVPAAATCARH